MMSSKVDTSLVPRLTSLSHGGGCGCKIAPGVLRDLLSRRENAWPVPEQLLVGIGTSDDAAVYQINEHQAIVATTDFFMPVVDDPYHFGQISATNAISDVYAMGGTPLFALAIVGMPVNTLPLEVIRRVLEGGESVCARAGIPVAGGHSIDSVEPIYGLVVIGLVDPKRVKKNADARPGDVLILGKPLGVGIYSAALKKNKLSAADYDHMINVTTQLNTPGRTLGQLSGVHGLTDVTGFGLLGHLLEMVNGSGVSARIDFSCVPLLPNALAYVQDGCVTGASGRNLVSYGSAVRWGEPGNDARRALLSDPQTSGGLLVSCSAEAVAEVLSIFVREGFEHACVIGMMDAEPPVGEAFAIVV